MVDLVAHYSKQRDQIKRTHTAARLSSGTWPDRPTVAIKPYRIDQRLAAADVERLVEEYRRGATGRELSARYGLARSTVIEQLRERGIDVRHPRISSDDAALAVEWYRQGVRQIDIAERLGRSKSVIWHLLKRAGVL